MRPIRCGGLAVFASVVGLSAALAGSKNRLDDPASSRLPTGSVAVLDPDAPEPRASVAVYLSPVTSGEARPRCVPVRARSRVEILDDSRASVINTFRTDATAVKGDDRDVKVLILDGAKAGLTGYTSRFFLRAARPGPAHSR